LTISPSTQTVVPEISQRWPGERYPRQTLSRRLTPLVGKGELIRVGEGSGSRYLRGDLQAYFRIPVAQRPRVTYIPERGTRDLPTVTSSSLEGNTYDLIQTEALIKYGQVAHGKTAHEAKMILNHRDAIHYLLENIATVAVDWTTLRDLHELLSDGLLDEPADSGRVRRRVVAIAHSSYTPLETGR
jgi:hypothetical protein